MNWANGLFFERARPTIPELEVIKGRVIDRRRLAPPNAAAHSYGCLSRICESGSRVVTKDTGNRLILGQTSVEIQLFPELDFRSMVEIRRGDWNHRRQWADIRHGHSINRDRAMRRLTERRSLPRNISNPNRIDE